MHVLWQVWAFQAVQGWWGSACKMMGLVDFELSNQAKKIILVSTL
jgi:hypothetical protein